LKCTTALARYDASLVGAYFRKPTADTKEKSMQLVESKSPILFSKAALISPNNVQAITWSQDLKSRTENFVQLMAALDSDKGPLVVFFVQQSLVDKLLSNSELVPESGDEYKAVVQAPMFRYGQDSPTNTKFRFLVYLDPLYHIYQHRFMNQTTLSRLAALANLVPNVIPYAVDVKKLVGIAQSVLGDPLRSFEG
jgi:hypothetical protein